MSLDDLLHETSIEEARVFLTGLWPDFKWDDEHLVNTPKRFVNMLKELTTPEEFEFTTFETYRDEMIICKNIDFHSLCKHHVVPYIGRAHVGYIPQGKMVGLSKIPRLVKYHAAGLSVQEELTTNIAQDLEGRLGARGVAVVLDAKHLCAGIRGVECPKMDTITSCMLGVFSDHSRLARQEFLHLIKD